MAGEGNNQDAHFEAIIGVTGCGKSTVLKKRLKALGAKRCKRTLIWSPKEKKDNYAALFKGSVVCRSVVEVLKVLDRAGGSEGRGGFHIVYVPTLDEKKDRAAFSAVCKLAMQAENMVFVAEELHSVTQAGNAPHGWRMVNFMGRASGLYVFGLAQRPASMDKAFLGSLSWLHVGLLPNPPDQKVMAEFLGVPQAEVAALSGYQGIQRDYAAGKITRV